MIPLLDVAAKKGAIALDIVGCFLVFKKPEVEIEAKLGDEMLRSAIVETFSFSVLQVFCDKHTRGLASIYIPPA